VEREVAPIGAGGERDGFLVQRKRRRDLGQADEAQRLTHEEMWNLHRRQAAGAANRHRIGGGGRGIARAILQQQDAGFLIAEIGQVHPPRRIEHATQLRQRGRGARGIVARDERRHFGVIDLDLHPLQAVRRGERFRFAHDLPRARIAAADLLVERAVHVPPHPVHRCHLGIGKPRLDALDQCVGGIAFHLPVEVVEQDRRGVDAVVDRHRLDVRCGEQLLDDAGCLRDARVLGLPEQQRDEQAAMHAQRIGVAKYSGPGSSRRSNTAIQRSSGAKSAHSK
jgi:hypothetical protein